MAKVLLRCLFNKFNLYKILVQEPKQLMGFSLGAANISGIFLLFRYFIQKLKQNIPSFKIDRNVELFMAGCASSLALRLFERGELNILKVLIYPKTIETFWELFRKKMIEKSNNNETVVQILNPPRGETFFCILMITICVYAFAFEPYALNSGLVARIEKLASLTNGERQMFEAFRFITREQIRRKYGDHEL